MDRVYASVCDPYEILISYPLVFNKNRYNNYEGGINKNEYKKRFEIGKELHDKNREIDSFNVNNMIYKEFCLGVEIDGKDLIFEDRYKYLYPNNASLCESNCTIDHTDFELERIVCACTYKEFIDFNRKEEERNDILNNPNFIKPEQSSANVEIIKCLSKLSTKEGLINNESFYYCAVITIVEVILVVNTAIYGINKISRKITKSLIRNNLINVIYANPPKKDNIEENDDDNDSENINYGMIVKNNGFSQNLNNNDLLVNKNRNNNNNINAEYIPDKYNSLYFKKEDKGVKRQIDRSQLPFRVKPETKYLIEKREGFRYDDNYLNGPFPPSQNIIELLDIKRNITKVVKFSEQNLNSKNKLILTTNSINPDIEFTRKKSTSKRKIKNSTLDNNFMNQDIEFTDNKSQILNNKNDILDNNYTNSNTEEKDFITIKKILPFKLKKEKENSIITEEYNIPNNNNLNNISLLKENKNI